MASSTGSPSPTDQIAALTKERDELKQENKRLKQAEKEQVDAIARIAEEKQQLNTRLARIQSELSNSQFGQQKNQELINLKREKEYLTKQINEFSKKIQGLESGSLGLAADALLASTAAENKADQHKEEVDRLVKSAKDAAAQAHTSDPGSVAALAAAAAVKAVELAQADALKEFQDVKSASRKVDELAGSLITHPKELTAAQKKSLSTAQGNLTKQLNALIQAMDKLKQAAQEASTQAAQAMQVHDNWEMLGSLFGFKSSRASTASATAEPNKSASKTAADPPTSTNSNRPDSNRTDTNSPIEEDTTVDNWALIQQKFDLRPPTTLSSNAATKTSTAEKTTSKSSKTTQKTASSASTKASS